jgi:8-oxo-dGTP diphosphatase
MIGRYRFGAAGVIVNDEGHVLLVKQSYGHFNWELPGGGVEPGESAAQAVLREVREETGLSVIVERLVGVYYEPAKDFLHFAFLCRRLNLIEQFQHDLEVLECLYWSVDVLPRPISDFTLRRIGDALSGQNQLLFESIGPRQWLDEATP